MISTSACTITGKRILPVLALREIRVLAELHGGSVHGVVSVEVDQIVIDAVLAGGISGFYHTESDPVHIPALFLELLGEGNIDVETLYTDMEGENV